MFSVIQDQQSSELSQGHIASRAKRLKVEQQELKLPRVTALDACQVLKTCHQPDGTVGRQESYRFQTLSINMSLETRLGFTVLFAVTPSVCGLARCWCSYFSMSPCHTDAVHPLLIIVICHNAANGCRRDTESIYAIIWAACWTTTRHVLGGLHWGYMR